MGDAHAPSERPRQTRLAVYLIWVGGVLSSFVDFRRIAPEHLSGSIILFSCLVGYVVIVGLFIWRRHDWARKLYLATFILSVAAVLLNLPAISESTHLAEDAINWLGLLLQAAAVYLLFTQPGRSWFRRPD